MICCVIAPGQSWCWWDRTSCGSCCVCLHRAAFRRPVCQLLDWDLFVVYAKQLMWICMWTHLRSHHISLPSSSGTSAMWAGIQIQALMWVPHFPQRHNSDLSDSMMPSHNDTSLSQASSSAHCGCSRQQQQACWPHRSSPSASPLSALTERSQIWPSLFLQSRERSSVFRCWDWTHWSPAAAANSYKRLPGCNIWS